MKENAVARCVVYHLMKEIFLQSRLAHYIQHFLTLHSLQRKIVFSNINVREILLHCFSYLFKS